MAFALWCTKFGAHCMQSQADSFQSLSASVGSSSTVLPVNGYTGAQHSGHSVQLLFYSVVDLKWVTFLGPFQIRGRVKIQFTCYFLGSPTEQCIMCTCSSVFVWTMYVHCLLVELTTLCTLSPLVYGHSSCDGA